MTLATKCPTCTTVFRVVQDQLRVSEGWVRCGRCSEVFNAVDQMVDVLAHTQSTLNDAHDDAIEIEAAPHIDIDAQSTQAPGPDESASDDVLVSKPESAMAPVSVAPADVPEPAVAADAELDLVVPTVEPSFLRSAERAQRWQRPWVRRSLIGATALASLLLLLQMTVEYRDLIAARWTSARAPLEVLCRWSGCRVEPPRLIDAMVVDSSGLTRVEGTNTYRLTLALRNRSAMALAMPAVDLALSDSQGRIISRRVLSAAELGAAMNTAPAGAEFALQATLAVAERLVAGYTIEVFYP